MAAVHMRWPGDQRLATRNQVGDGFGIEMIFVSVGRQHQVGLQRVRRQGDG